jgi:hypothetical protein
VKKKPIRILEKPTGSVWFWFYKIETEKTESNPNRKKPEKTEPNQFELVFFQNNQTETGQFEPISDPFWFFFNQFWLLFFIYKNQIEPKMITPTS